MEHFTITNESTDTVSVKRSEDGGEWKLWADLSPGEQRHDLPLVQGDHWRAYEGGEQVSVYAASERVPHWTIAAGAHTDFIPALDTAGNEHLLDGHEGATDDPYFQHAMGELKGVMVFVDFPDHPHTDNSRQRAIRDARKLCEDSVPEAEKWFSRASYQRLCLSVDVMAGWETMPQPIETYDHTNPEKQQAYASAALAQFPQIDFAEYGIVYIVAVETPAETRLSGAFTLTAPLSDPIRTQNGSVRHVATFGSDSDRPLTRCTWRGVVHETGHLFGLPDLWDGSPADPHKADWFRWVGAWDIMSNSWNGRSFLGWHKYKLGWIDPAQIVCLTDGELDLTLSPWDPETEEGIKAVMVPVNRSKAYMIEQSQPIGDTEEYRFDGVLIYTVDASVPAGRGPIKVKPHQADLDPNDEYLRECGPLYSAPFREGDVFQESGGSRNIRVEVREKSGNDFLVNVQRAPW